MGNLARIQKRANLATSHAVRTSLERFTYSIDLNAWGVPAGLSCRAVSLLTALAVLNRAGEIGYCGTRCARAELAAFVLRVVSNARMSVPTLDRAIGELRERGFLTVGRYGVEPRECVNKRSGEVYWIRDQLLVLTLTDRALRLWDRGPVSHTSPRRSKVCSYDIPSASGSSLRSEPKKTLPREGGALASSSASEAVPGVVVARTLDADRTVERSACKPSGCAVIDRTLADLDGLQVAKSDGNPRAKSGRFRGLRNTSPTTRGLAARAILAAMIVSLERHGRSGKRAIARAALELADPCSESSGVPWDYWCSRWGQLSPAERRSICRSTLFPMLAGAGAPPPRAALVAVPDLPPDLPCASPPVEPVERVDVRAILRESAEHNPFARALLDEEKT